MPWQNWLFRDVAQMLFRPSTFASRTPIPFQKAGVSRRLSKAPQGSQRLPGALSGSQGLPRARALRGYQWLGIFCGKRFLEGSQRLLEDQGFPGTPRGSAKGSQLSGIPKATTGLMTGTEHLQEFQDEQAEAEWILKSLTRVGLQELPSQERKAKRRSSTATRA